MVAPYELGEPVRSFVRVPTKVRAAKALCWDLSRSSSVVAATAPIQLPLLQAQLQPGLPQDPAGSSLKPGQEQATTTASAPAPAPASQQQAAATPCVPKRPREEEEEHQEDDESSSKPVLKVARTAGSAEAGGSSSPPQSPQCINDEVQWLRQQCQTLRQQNKDLVRRLGLFHGLFQDKQRLNSFVRHLDTLELAAEEVVVPVPANHPGPGRHVMW